MTYVTPLGATPVLSDQECRELGQEVADSCTIDGHKYKTGYIKRDYRKQPHGTIQYAAPLPIPVIPRSKWPELIRLKDESKTRLSDTRKRFNMPSSDQDGTNYCWMHGCVNAVRLRRAEEGQPNVMLNAAGPAAIVKRGSNSGGNTPEAIRHLAEHGVPEMPYWPGNSRSLSNVTEAMKQNSLRHRINRWFELRRNNFEQLVTCLLLNLPCPIGLSWWGHLIVAMDPVILGANEFGIRIWNSWSDRWKDNGESVLTERKATAFDQFALASTINYQPLTAATEQELAVAV